MAMKNPPHPGRSVRENCLDPLGRLEKAGWSKAEFWLRRHSSYDLVRAREGREGEDRIDVERYQPQPMV